MLLAIFRDLVSKNRLFLFLTSFVSQLFQRFFSDGNLSSKFIRARAVIDPLFGSQVKPATIL